MAGYYDIGWGHRGQANDSAVFGQRSLPGGNPRPATVADLLHVAWRCQRGPLSPPKADFASGGRDKSTIKSKE